MRYLVINGSPHRGNTWKLTLQAMETIRTADATAEFDEVHLGEANLSFCLGCSACFRLGHEKCRIMAWSVRSSAKSKGRTA